jgi:beta-phosphoglucomutase-like phosphatase (HAD superfamily)
VYSDEVSSGKPNPTLFLHVHAITGFLTAKALTFEASDIGIEVAHGAKRINFSPSYSASRASIIKFPSC